MNEPMTLDDFMANLRELPEFAEWSDDKLRSLYSTDYLPKFQAQQPMPQQRGLLEAAQAPAGSASVYRGILNSVPVGVSFQPQSNTVGADALLHSGRDDAVSARATKSLGGKGWGVGIQYQRRF